MWDWLHTHQSELQSLTPVAIISAAIIAAGVTAFFGFLQFRIARSQRDIAQNKLKLELFASQYERRVGIYEATRTFLADVYEERISDATIKAYGLRTLDAKFLFYDDPTLHKYLTELRSRVAMWHHAKTSMETTQSSEEKKAFENIATEQLTWIRQQGDDTSGFDVKFISFLVYSVASKSWLR